MLFALAKLLMSCWLKEEEEGACSFFLTLVNGPIIGFIVAEL